MESDLQKKDQQYNWHPYTQHFTSPLPIVITRGKGALLWDEEGREYIDAIGSWWANPHGHCNPEISNAISLQINTLEHVLFGGYTHPSAINLSEKLIEYLPGFSKVFYSDNGSTAVEVGLKMALQFFLNQGIKKKTCIAFENAFHGDTFGAMSVSGISLFSNSFEEILLPVKKIPLPNSSNWESVKVQFQQLIQNNSVYAFIFEPLVQGANGMAMYPPEYLDALIRIAQDNQVICIADEVMTGFGRTGKLFAIDYLTEVPDIICLSKALTGGFIPMAATITQEYIFEGFSSEKVEKALFHGHTFMANPAGCAAALASLKLSTSIDTQKNIERIQQAYAAFREKLKDYSFVTNIRNLGVIFAFEVDLQQDTTYYGALRAKIYDFYIQNRIIIRPIGNTIYFLPPYCITNVELERIFELSLNLLNILQNETF